MNLKLPYQIDETKAVAKFDKSTCTLSVSTSILKIANSSFTPTPCHTSSDSPPENVQSKKTRKRNRRRKRSRTNNLENLSVPAAKHIIEPDEGSLHHTNKVNHLEETHEKTKIQTSDSELFCVTKDRSVEYIPDSINDPDTLPINKVPIVELILTKDR